MISKIFFKLSSLSLRVHRLFNRLARRRPDFRPYEIKYTSDQNNPKIIHVIGNLIIGGSTQLLVDIIEGTSNDFFHRVVVPARDDLLAYQPLDVHPFAITELQSLHRFLKSEKPGLVHVHYFVRKSDKFSEGALWYQTIFEICDDLDLKIIQNVNVPTYPNPSPAVVHNVFVSKYVEREFNTVDAEHSVIYPGSNFEHFSNDDADSLPAKNIGMVYRLDSDKLRADAIEVFIAAVKKDPEIKAHIVGGGYFLEDYKRRVREVNLESNIFFTGFVSYDQLPEMYKKFSIFVAPVHDESFGQVTPFAMGMGLCVVGYNTGALSEILGSDETLAERGDVVGLARIIVDLANDPPHRKKIGARNRQRASELFSVKQMVSEYKELFRALLVNRDSEQ